MNRYQELWLLQAQTDHQVFVLLRREGAPACHALHYLQMATEKIAKAYFWRSGSPPPKSHSGFVQFLRFLGQFRRQADRQRIAALFSFNRFADFQNWIRNVLPIAYELERLAPDLAQNGPNPEYPWPHDLPQYAPVDFEFPVWDALTSGQGRDLMRVVQIAVERFSDFADA
jgi:hypothetical protein